MISKNTYIIVVMQLLATLLLLSVVCISSNELPRGEMAKQWWWLSQAGIIYAIMMSLSLLFYKKGEKIVHYSRVVGWSLILLGGYEAILGLCQIYGLINSNHSLFLLTGTFLNPGPYSGYLAMVFPVCLYEYFQFKKTFPKSLQSKIAYYITLSILLSIVCVLPAGMSRSSWLAGIISVLFVLWYQYDWKSLLKKNWAQNKKKVIILLMSGCICLLILAVSVFYLKKDSANGRLFMWKISLKSIIEHPLRGHGLGSFPVVYGETQETYFAKGNYAQWEEYVAGSPEYAFNEYLQIAMECGIPMLLFILLIVIICFWCGIKKQFIGICGGILSLSVFSLSSYPLQLPVFIVTLSIMLFSCIVGFYRLRILFFSLLVGLISIYLYKTNDYEKCKQWADVRVLYNMNAYKSAETEYHTLYTILKNRAEFMFEYGHCLHKLEKYDLSNQILHQTTLLTSDPMVLNIIGKNHHMLGNYKEAEKYYKRSINRLPGRIYPYYLLAKLYAEPNFLNIEKFKHAAHMVLEKEPKVYSPAVQEMREEIESLKEKMQ